MPIAQDCNASTVDPDQCESLKARRGYLASCSRGLVTEARGFGMNARFDTRRLKWRATTRVATMSVPGARPGRWSRRPLRVLTKSEENSGRSISASACSGRNPTSISRCTYSAAVVKCSQPRWRLPGSRSPSARGAYFQFLGEASQRWPSDYSVGSPKTRAAFALPWR